MQPTIINRNHSPLFNKCWDAISEEDLLKDKQTLFVELIRPIESQMMRSIWRIVRNQEAAKDTLQEVLTIIWKKLERVYGHPNPKALILKICANASIDALRKMKHDPRQLLQDQAVLPPSRIEAQQVETEVMAAIRRLSKKQALAILMRLVQDQPYDIIAQVLRCSEVTARIHVSKARKNLSQKLAHLLPASFQENSE